MTVDAPFALAAGVYLRTPSVSTVGWLENSDEFVTELTTNVTVSVDSSDGPGLIAVAQGSTVWAPGSSRSV